MQDGGPDVRGIRSALTEGPAIAVPLSTLGRIAGLMWLCAGLSTFATSFLPGWPAQANLTGLRLAAGLGIAYAVLAAVIGSSRPRWSYHFSMIGSVVLITASILMAGAPPFAIAISVAYSYVIVGSVLFFGRLGAMFYAAVFAGAASVSLTIAGVPPAFVFMMVVVGLSLAPVADWLARAAAAVEIDQLTGLPNRQATERVIETALARAQRGFSDVSVVLLDLDNFRSVNAEHGHLETNTLLKSIADSWSAHLREEGALGRFGSDEFAVILPGTAPGRAADVADELCGLLPPPLTASAGVTAWQPHDTVTTICSRANGALYDAKTAGGDRATIHGDPLRTVSSLEAGIANGELTLEYHPIVDLPRRRAASYEARVRWDHPTRGALRPDDFLPAAEMTGAVHALGRWAVNEAVRMAAFLTARGARIDITVNASATEMRSSGYVAMIRSTLAAYRLDPGRLTVEVAERAFENEDPQVETALAELRAAGVKIAVDDFGSGYSSLQLLGHSPVDVLKVDSVFVDAITDQQADTRILEGIVGIGRALGVMVVMEGVRTKTQADQLRRIGVDYAQGAFFGGAESVPLRHEPLAV